MKTLRLFAVASIFVAVATNAQVGGDDPPPGLSPMAKKLWGIFMQDPPQYSGLTELLNNRRIWSNEFFPALDELAKNPAVAARAKEGSAFFRRYIDQMKAKITRNGGRDFGARLDALPDALKSFDTLMSRSKRASERPYTEIEATNAARSDMLRKHPGVVNFEEKPKLLQKYNRLVQHYRLMTTHSPMAPPGEKEFNQWKTAEMARLDKIIGENQKRILILEMKNFGRKDLRLSELLPDGSALIDDPRAQALTPDVLEHMEVRYQSVHAATEDQISAGKSRARYVVEMGDRKYAIATTKRDFPYYQYILHDGAWTGSSGDPNTHFQYLLLKEIEQTNQDLLAFKDLLAGRGGNSTRSTDILKLRATWEKNIKATRAKLAEAIAAAARQHRAGENDIFNVGTNSELIHELTWWGFERDFDYWARRERTAVSNSRPKAQFSKEPLPNDTGPDNRISEIPEGLILSPKEPTNNAPPTEDMKKPLFRYSKRSGAESDVGFFALMDPGAQGERAVPAAMGATDSWTINLDTQVPIPSAQGTVVIPTPNLYELTGLEVRSTDGTVLSLGKDYQVFKTSKQNGYFIRLTDPARAHVEFVAKFKPGEAKHVKPSQLGKIEPRQLAPLILELKKGGFSALAAGLEKRAEFSESQGVQLTVEEIAHVFKNTAFYSYVPERPHSPSHQGRFAKYARFLDGNGRLCAQCDGSNALYSDFMAAYFEDTPQVSVGVQLGFSAEGNELQLATLHAQTEFKLNGAQAYIADVTPHVKDPRNETAPLAPIHHEAGTPLPRVRMYSDKLKEKRRELLNAFEKAGTIDPAEPFAKAVRMSTVVNDFINGEITFTEAKTRLQAILPGITHGYSTLEELLGFVSQTAAREKALLLQHQRRSLRGELPPARYARYSEPKKNDALLASLEHLETIDKILGPEELREHWRTVPRSCQSLADMLKAQISPH